MKLHSPHKSSSFQRNIRNAAQSYSFQVKKSDHSQFYTLLFCHALTTAMQALARAAFTISQLAQNADTQILTNTKKYEYITSVLANFHWPVTFCINLKMGDFNFYAGRAPNNITNLIHLCAIQCSSCLADAGLLFAPRAQTVYVEHLLSSDRSHHQHLKTLFFQEGFTQVTGF